MTNWRKGLKELEKDISKFCRAFSDEDGDLEFTTLSHETDPQMIVHGCKTKLQKTKENINTRLKTYIDTKR